MFVFSNLATSLDGKIATASRELFPLGTPEDRKQMMVLRQECDAVLMGAATLRPYRLPLIVRGANDQPINVLISSDLGGLKSSWKYFTDKKIRRILFVGPKTPKARIKTFSRSSEVISLKAGRRSVAEQIVEALHQRGIRRLLVEGGGSVMWDFAKHDLIDEYHVTLTPRILGGTQAPTLVDGEGFEPRKSLNLRLAQCRVVGDELYLIYRKTGRRGP
jgi:2,5-diamino-6-(ribosylamino)-4(3H)-pyrimidinone 5'-phosphate reductase